jgi:hypothetical protein
MTFPPVCSYKEYTRRYSLCPYFGGIYLTAYSKEEILPGMAKIQVWVWQCERCGHEWMPRDRDATPKVCPKCKSPYWDRPRKTKET